MKKNINSNQKIGQIASLFPKAIEIFMKYQIDFCCGGDRSLNEALKEQEIDEEAILNELNINYEEFSKKIDEVKDWKNESNSDLIDYIVNKHHNFMKEELPLVSNLLNKILKVHYVDNGKLLSKLNKLFTNLKIELEEHLIKEEEILFPLIKEYENNPSKELLNKISIVMNETESEHDVAGDILKEMRKITHGYKVPETGCRTFELTYEKIQNIEYDLFNHIHLENNILFKKI